MRAFTLFACLALLGTPALAGPFEGSDDFKAHLEVLGYTVEESDKSLIATHDEFYNVAVKPYSGGILVITFFDTTSRAQSQRVGFFEFLNGMNRDAVAARYYEDDEGDVIVEGWYPGDYERTRFGVFMNMFNEAGEQLGQSEVADEYLGSDEPAESPVAPPPSATTTEEPAQRPSATSGGERKAERVGRTGQRASEGDSN